MKNSKNIIRILLISFGMFLLLAMFSMHNISYGVIEDKYSYTSGENTCIDEKSGLNLISYDFNGLNFGVLGYLNDNIKISDEGYISSFISGKKCISLMAIIVETDTNLNKNILSDIVGRVRDRLNSDNFEVFTEQRKIDTPYIVSKNDTDIIIDYVTGCKSSQRKVIFYRIIIQDLRDLDVDISEDEYNSLNNNLPVLLKVLGIPAKDLGITFSELEQWPILQNGGYNGLLFDVKRNR